MEFQTFTTSFPLIYADVLDANSHVKVRGGQDEELSTTPNPCELGVFHEHLSTKCQHRKSHDLRSAVVNEYPETEITTSTSVQSYFRISNGSPRVTAWQTLGTVVHWRTRQSSGDSRWCTRTRALKLGNQKHVSRLQLSRKAGDLHSELPTTER